MEYKFLATLTALVEIPDKDFSFIEQEASRHYDYKVQQTTQVGGFLYGSRNRREWAKKDKPDYYTNKIELTQNKIGLLMKAVEMNNSDQAHKISGDLYKIAMELQRKEAEINSKLNDL